MFLLSLFFAELPQLLLKYGATVNLTPILNAVRREEHALKMSNRFLKMIPLSKNSTPKIPGQIGLASSLILGRVDVNVFDGDLIYERIDKTFAVISEHHSMY